MARSEKESRQGAPGGANAAEKGDFDAVALSSGRVTFRPECLAAVRRLSALSPARGFLGLIADWAMIVAAMTAAAYSSHPVVLALVVFVLATRQHAFFVLVHDAAHYRILRSRRWNDIVGDLCFGLSVGIPIRGFRIHHLLHHQHLGSDGDPDVRRKRRPDWRFPMTRRQLLLTLLFDVCGRGLVDMGIMMKFIGPFSKLAVGSRGWRAYLGPIAFYAAVLAVTVSFERGWEFLALWMFAWGFVLPPLVRLRSVGEHHSVPERTVLSSTRTTLAPLWERFAISPHNINYHLEHHLFPAVPYYNLPRLHRCLMESSVYRAEAYTSAGYLGFDPGLVMHDLTQPAVEQEAGMNLGNAA